MNHKRISSAAMAVHDHDTGSSKASRTFAVLHRRGLEPNNGNRFWRDYRRLMALLIRLHYVGHFSADSRSKKTGDSYMEKQCTEMMRFDSDDHRRAFLIANGAVLTGSRAFGVNGPGSDEDWLVPWELAEQMGIQLDPDSKIEYWGDDGKSITVPLFTARDGIANYIVPAFTWFWDAWMRAHRHCLIERPESKERRIDVFSHYLYGTDLDFDGLEFDAVRKIRKECAI
jgi:hypothetical protein